jgi:hypothetical protein
MIARDPLLLTALGGANPFLVGNIGANLHRSCGLGGKIESTFLSGGTSESGGRQGWHGNSFLQRVSLLIFFCHC